MIKILNQDDAALFNDALDDYYENTDHLKSGYTVESRKEFINIHKELFTSGLRGDYSVVGDFVDNRIIGLAIGYRNDLLIDRACKNILPGWHLAFTWRNTSKWSAPKSFIFDITNPISLHMENMGVFEFTKVMRFSAENARRVGMAEYLDRVYIKNIPDGRYDAFVEAAIETESDVEKLPFILKRIMPDQILTPLLVVKHSLKNEIRQKYILNDYRRN
jgi:hypothetical protein